MGDEGADRNWIEVSPERDRAKSHAGISNRDRIGLSRLWIGRGDDDRVVPFRHRQRSTIDGSDQERILMHLERMIRKGAIDDCPLLVVSRIHVVE